MIAVIPQADPGANYRAHQVELDESIASVLRGDRYINGHEVRAFETEFGAFHGGAHAIGVGSGTDALHLAIRACGIGPGDAVLTVSHTAVETVAAIELAGATPILTDIGSRTYAMDPGSLEDRLGDVDTSRVKAVIPVHLYGHPVDMPSLMATAKRHGWLVIEDCAQSCGASLHGRLTGTWGDIAAFSFYPTKNLGAIGDGGAVVTARDDLADRVRLLREYGWRERYVSEIAGMNSRLDELQAAILRVKLRYLNDENVRRRAIASHYCERLSGLPLALPESGDGVVHAYHQFVIRCSARDSVRAALRARGVETLVHYPVPVHLQPAYRNRTRTLGDLGESESAANEVLSLPMYPELTDAQVEHVAQSIQEVTTHDFRT